MHQVRQLDGAASDQAVRTSYLQDDQHGGFVRAKNGNTKTANTNGNPPQNSPDELMTLQDAAKEFGVYPSVMRAWYREGRLPTGSLDNVRVRRSALVAAIEANARAALAATAAPVARPEEGEIALARRVLEVCASPTPDNLKALAFEARSILDRLG